MSMNMPAGKDDDEIDLGQLLGAIWKGKKTVGLFVAMGIAAGVFLIANTHPTYQSDALMQLEGGRGSSGLAVPTSLAAMMDGDARSVTEIELLRSRMVLGQAVASLNLDWRVAQDTVPVVGTLLSRYRLPIIDGLLPSRFARPDDSLTLEELVVPPQWLDQDLEIVIEEAGRFRLTLPDGMRTSAEIGERISMPELGFALTIEDISAERGRRFVLRQIDELRAINSLRSRFSVSESGRGSGILTFRMTGPDKHANTRALDAIIEAYQRQNVARSAAQAEGSLEFIREQLPRAERALRDAEAALDAFRQQQETVNLSLETQTLLDQITRLEGELATLQRQEDELAQRFTPAHPRYRQLLNERERIENRMARLRERVGDLPETQRQILNLSRELELAQGIYTELLTRANDLEVLRASTIGNVRIIDTAASGTSPVAPRRVVVLGVSVILGLMAGIALVLLRNWMRKGVQDGSELEQMGLSLFATVNYSKGADTGGKRHGKLPVLALEQPTDLTVESLRSLRTSLHFGMLDASTPTLSITSSHPGAGKSFLSINLAAVAAQAGQRVCLIDADMRRGQLRRYFDTPRDQKGLAEVLSGNAKPDDVVVKGPVEGFYFLPTGQYPPNPAELLMRGELNRLIEWCGQNFDLAIFDAPPVLAVTDPVVLARSVGATIFVARHDMTAPNEVLASMKSMESAGLRFSGAILNGFDPKKARDGGYGYGYRYEYTQRQD